MFSAQLRNFYFPPNLAEEERLNFCLTVINKLRNEQVYLRKQRITLTSERNKARKDAIYWRKKYQEEKEKANRLKRENDKLVKDLERFLITNNRYQVALFDHGNFIDRNNSPKAKGGQLGHTDTNRERNENRQNFPKIHLFTKKCPQCGTDVNRTKAIKEKLLIDIKLNPEAIKLLIQSERQWCNLCHKEINAKHPQSLPFSEYGVNTLLGIILLRFGANLSLGKIALVLKVGFGLTISKGEIVHLLSSAKTYLKDKYEKLKEAARKREITYHDETGWLIHGQSAWLWIMTTSEGETVYVAAESRGKGIIEETYGNSCSIAMHDGLSSYEKVVPPDNQAYCWAHLLRFAFEETVRAKKGADSIRVRDKLVSLYRLQKSQTNNLSSKEAEKHLKKELANLCLINSKEEACLKIQKRLRKQKRGLIQALLLTPDGTNNLAERELRSMVISKRISFGSDTFSGMETSAILGSVYRTTVRSSSQPLVQLRYDLLEGVKRKYPQFLSVSSPESFSIVKS